LTGTAGRLIAASAFVQLAIGVLQVLLPIQLVNHRASTLMVGVVAAAYSAGFVIGCWTSPRLIRGWLPC
jgi:cyanate permease